MRKGTLKKALALALTGAVLVGAFAGCGAKKDSSDKKETKKIVIGASPSPHADILKVATFSSLAQSWSTSSGMAPIIPKIISDLVVLNRG